MSASSVDTNRVVTYKSSPRCHWWNDWMFHKVKTPRCTYEYVAYNDRYRIMFIDIAKSRLFDKVRLYEPE